MVKIGWKDHRVCFPFLFFSRIIYISKQCWWVSKVHRYIIRLACNNCKRDVALCYLVCWTIRWWLDLKYLHFGSVSVRPPSAIIYSFASHSLYLNIFSALSFILTRIFLFYIIGPATATATSGASNNCSLTSVNPLQKSNLHQKAAMDHHHHHPASSLDQTTSSTTATTNSNNVKMMIPDDYQYLCNLVPELKTELKERESRLDLYQTETLELKRRLKKRDEEIGRLQREIHKLKVF